MASQINATVGQSVLLPCFLASPPPPSETRVYWQTEEANGKHEDVLHFVNNGVEELIHQGRQYQNRTALDLSQLASGNFSLQLKNLTADDNQTNIQCLFRDSRGVSPRIVNRITLLVLEERPIGEPEVPELPSFPNWVIVLLVALTLLLLLLLLYKARRKFLSTRQSTETPRANGTTEHGERMDQGANGTATGREQMGEGPNPLLESGKAEVNGRPRAVVSGTEASDDRETATPQHPLLPAPSPR